jgi:transcription antitermination factor NusG
MIDNIDKILDFFQIRLKYRNGNNEVRYIGNLYNPLYYVYFLIEFVYAIVTDLWFIVRHSPAVIGLLYSIEKWKDYKKYKEIKK